MDMQQGDVDMPHGNMDMLPGKAAWTCNMDSQNKHAAGIGIIDV